jgi:asparagine synthase (glutamine-hydrolysing)
MLQLLAHRGPDDEGRFVSGPVALGHRRLAILDLSAAGHQPMANPAGSAWIVCNGECYNYRSFYPILKSRGWQFRSRSDTEVMLALYEEYGPAFLEQTDGMYALAIWDAKCRRLLLARDRIGIKPLYYWDDGRRLLFASEMKAFLADPAFSPALDPVALRSFFRFMSIPDATGIFRGVRKLPPGHCLTVENGTVTTHRYWELPTLGPDTPAPSLAQACEDFSDRWRHTVASHLVSDTPVGAFLSGGIDSSAVVAAAASQLPTPLRTFTIALKGSPELDEGPWAGQVASHLGTEHTEFDLKPDLVSALPAMVWHGDEPLAISSAFALYFLSKLARQQVKVALSGDGGDEVFAGYPWRHRSLPHLPYGIGAAMRAVTPALEPLFGSGSEFWRKSGKLWRLISAPPDLAYSYSVSCFLPTELQELLEPDWLCSLAQMEDEDAVRRAYAVPGSSTELNRRLQTDLKTTLVSEMLTKVDRMSMAFGLEVRVPFLDHRLVEWAFRLPDACKLEGQNGKRVVKQAMAPLLPPAILDRPKQGFNLPMREWLQTDLRTLFLDAVTSRRFGERGLYRPRALRRLTDQFFRGQAVHPNKLFLILTLELWFQLMVDRQSPPAVLESSRG